MEKLLAYLLTGILIVSVVWWCYGTTWKQYSPTTKTDTITSGCVMVMLLGTIALFSPSTTFQEEVMVVIAYVFISGLRTVFLREFTLTPGNAEYGYENERPARQPSIACVFGIDSIALASVLTIKYVFEE